MITSPHFSLLMKRPPARYDLGNAWHAMTMKLHPLLRMERIKQRYARVDSFNMEWWLIEGNCSTSSMGMFHKNMWPFINTTLYLRIHRNATSRLTCWDHSLTRKYSAQIKTLKGSNGFILSHNLHMTFLGLLDVLITTSSYWNPQLD